MKSKKPLFPIILVLIVFLPSFMMSKNFTDPFIQPKFFYFYFLSAVFFGTFMLWSFNRKYQSAISLTWLDMALIIYVAYQFFQVLFSKTTGFSNDSFLVLLESVILYFCIKPSLVLNETNKRTIHFLIGGFLIIGIAQSIFGLLQLFGVLLTLQKQFQISGAFGNPGPYSNFVVVLLPFSLVMFLYSEKGRFHIFSLIALVIMLIILPLTKARTAWIATMISFSYVLYYRFGINIIIKNWLISIWAKLAALAAIIIIIIISGLYLFKFKEESASGRLFVWKVTTQMIKDKPVFGYGYDSFSAVHNNYQAKYFEMHPNADKEAALADWVNYAFNEYLQEAAETGILGLILLFIPIALVFYKTKAVNEIDKIRVNYFLVASKASLIAMLVVAMFSYPLRSVPINVFFILLLAIISANSSIEIKTIKLSQKNRRVLSTIGVFLLLIFLYNQTVKYKATKQWLVAFNMLHNGQNGNAIKLYEHLYPVLHYNQYFLFNYGAELSVLGNYNRSLEILNEAEPRLDDSDEYIYLGNSYEGNGDLNTALNCFKKASLIMPIKFYPKYRLAKIYQRMGKTQDAITMAKQILSMPVKVPSDVIMSIRNEMQQLVNSN